MSAIEILSTGNLAVAAALVPIIVGLVQVIKMVGLPDRFAPATAVLLGIGTGFLFSAGASIQATILYGVLAGLSAAGLYSGVKKSAGL